MMTSPPPLPRRPLVIAFALLGSSMLVGCSSSSDVLMASDYHRGETMAIQDARYKTYAVPGSTGTIEHPGVNAGGLTPLAASTDVNADKDVSRFAPMRSMLK